VIKDKYLPYSSVETWLRSAQTTQPMASHFWKCLMKSLPLITHWLNWMPCRGDAIVIGLDKVLGMGNCSILTHELIEELRAHNIYFLYQAKFHHNRGFVTNQWKSSDELGLLGLLAQEWTSYTRALIDSGI